MHKCIDLHCKYLYSLHFHHQFVYFCHLKLPVSIVFLEFIPIVGSVVACKFAIDFKILQNKVRDKISIFIIISNRMPCDDSFRIGYAISYLIQIFGLVSICAVIYLINSLFFDLNSIFTKSAGLCDK